MGAAVISVTSDGEVTSGRYLNSSVVKTVTLAASQLAGCASATGVPESTGIVTLTFAYL
ncbi:MAG: hypothetical protein PUP90_24435 [Nostoc sp. S4]|nr:hypothetical protein [Nostoc sp. S4]